MRLHALCQVGQDPAECEARLAFLIEALGVSSEAVVTEVSHADEEPKG